MGGRGVCMFTLEAILWKWRASGWVEDASAWSCELGLGLDQHNDVAVVARLGPGCVSEYDVFAQNTPLTT